MLRRRHGRWVLVALAALACAACGKSIGDSCNTNIDCSLNADRTCDLSQTSGYCTIPNCNPDSCPSEAMCIEFESSVPRLARRFCVKRCNHDSDCRGGYFCAGTPSPSTYPSTPVIGPADMCPSPTTDLQNGEAPTCTRLIDQLLADGGRPMSGYCTQIPTH